jgi:hypothetical protein
MKKISLLKNKLLASILTISFFSAGIIIFNGCSNFTIPTLPDIPIGGPKRVGTAAIKTESLKRFLAASEIDTSYILAAVSGCLRKGTSFRERIRDRRNRWTVTTIWIDAQESYILHIKTQRTIECPYCNGSGIRKTSFDLKGINIRCPKCEGSGKLKNHKEEKKYILTQADLEYGTLPEVKNRIKTMKAPPLTREEKRMVAAIASKDPKERVKGMVWLDTNYVRLGVFFHKIMPMLRKAIWIETDEEHGITLYQFRAGKEVVPEKAYYRIFVDKIRGTVERKGFVSIKQKNKATRLNTGMEEKLKERTDNIYRWFTDGWD